MVRQRMQAVADMYVFYGNVLRRFYIYRSKVPESSHSRKTELVSNLLSRILCCAYDSYVDIISLNELHKIIIIHHFDIIYLDAYKPWIDFKYPANNEPGFVVIGMVGYGLT